MLCVSYKTVSVTFHLVHSNKKKVIGHASTKHVDIKSRGLVVGFRLHTNVTVIFHSTVLMESQHVNRTPEGLHKIKKTIKRAMHVLEEVIQGKYIDRAVKNVNLKCQDSNNDSIVFIVF
jgi:hypothetical protein